MIQKQKTKNKVDKEYFENVIAYNIINNSRYTSSIIDHYDSDYIDNIDIKNIIPVVIDFYQRRNELPNLSEIKSLLSTDELKESFKNLLLSFKTLDKNFNEDELLSNTEDFLREKAVFKAIKKSASKLSSDNLEVSEILPEFEKACNISLVDSLGFEYFNSIDQHCYDLTKKVETLSCGWKWLDDMLGGGFSKDGRQLIVFAGRSNVGKSIFLGNIALNIVKQNKKALIISLEMPETLYAKRITSQLTKIPLNDLHKKISDLKSTVLDFKNQNGNATLFIKEFPPKSVTVSHINSYIKKLKQKGHVFDAIIVDYLNLLKPSKQVNTSYEEMKMVAEQLRATSYLFNAPVITATQFNRKGYTDSNPGMEATSESMGIAMTADALISIWVSDEDKAAGIINMGIAKNRVGPSVGNTILGIDYNTLLIRELNVKKDDTKQIDNDEINNTLSELENIDGINGV
jgi:replicative DNA helicase